VGTISDGFEEAEEGDFMGREARLRDGGWADLGDANRTTSQRGEDEAVGKMATPSEAKRWI
jgi:hypothetical protein